MRVKAKPDFSYYRLQALNGDGPGITVEDFRSLQQGKVVDVGKDFYNRNKIVLELAGGKGLKDGD